MDFLARLKQSPSCSTEHGTEIYDRGVFIQACYDELCVSNPGSSGRSTWTTSRREPR
jgi:hypothetical protein